ncbi:MAG: hypothetical protein U0263_41855 [Polyangiaceae bacterium]
MPHRIRKRVAETLEAECAAELEHKNKVCSEDPKGKTIVIEAARGGPNGAAFPLTPPVGYGSTFQQLSEQILERSSILYIWVDPAESRRKNIERGRPDGQGSILHHSVPMEVMLGQYGCDDMDWLIAQSDRPDTVQVERIFEDKAADGHVSYRDRIFHLPVARFDNRSDKTSFVRGEPSSWKKTDVDALHGGLKAALTCSRGRPAAEPGARVALCACRGRQCNVQGQREGRVGGGNRGGCSAGTARWLSHRKEPPAC